MADNTSKYKCTYIIVNKTQANSCEICGYNNRYTQSRFTEKTENSSKRYKSKTKMISNKRGKDMKNTQNKSRDKRIKSNRMYGYSKDTKKITISKNTNNHRERYTQKPVTNITSLKYGNNNNSHVNSYVLCTLCKSTHTGEYTRQLSKNGTERGYTGVVNAKVVCNKKATHITANIQKYSTSDITEMAENNGPMDVDPEGHRVYGPYGKLSVNIITIVPLICKNLMRCNTLNTVERKYGRYNDAKIRVRCKVCRRIKISEYMVCVYPEAVVIDTSSARNKTVTIQSSSWHKEYGE
jgi:hypothetical protein